MRPGWVHVDLRMAIVWPDDGGEADMLLDQLCDALVEAANGMQLYGVVEGSGSVVEADEVGEP